jgi:hypothetical protein
MRIRLSNGETRHVQIADWGQAEAALLHGSAPFSARWIHTVEQTLVQLSQVVEVQRVELGEPAIETLRPPRLGRSDSRRATPSRDIPKRWPRRPHWCLTPGIADGTPTG